MLGRGGYKIVKKITILHSGVSASIIIELTLVSPWLVKLFTAPPFHNSWPIVGIMAWQPLFYGFLLIASSGIWKSEKTYLKSYLIGITSILGLGFNWLMVPVYGIYGAALATIITYAILVSITLYVSERLWRVDFPVSRMVSMVVIAGSFIGWFVSSDFHENIHLKFITGLLISISLAFSSIPDSEGKLQKALKVIRIR